MKSLLSESMFSPYFAYLLKSPCLKMRHQKTFHTLSGKQLLLLILMLENSHKISFLNNLHAVHIPKSKNKKPRFKEPHYLNNYLKPCKSENSNNFLSKTVFVKG